MPFAICLDCNQEMKHGVSCTAPVLEFSTGEKLQRIPYENEFVPEEERATHCCHDCNVKYGGIHHRGCDMERCPKCKGQLLSCDCWE